MTPAIAQLLSRPVLEAAPGLLGMRLTTVVDGEPTSLRLTEVEAYGGADDPASHAHRGRTGRNAPMFADPGTVYVYRSYGIHWCVNIVTGSVGEPQAVLLRAGEPVEGLALMQTRRGRNDHVADGPGKLTQALGIDASDNGTILGEGRISLLEGDPPAEVVASPRIGISRATSRRWRFSIAP